MDEMMEYKGYHAKIKYSQEDSAFIGKVFGIVDTLVFDGQSIKELQEAFHSSVDDYLKLCKKIGKTPEREYKGSFNIRIPEQMHRTAAVKAESKGISLNQYVINALKYYEASEA